MIRKFFNVLNPDEIKICTAHLDADTWSFSGRSHKNAGFKLWYKELKDIPFFNFSFFNKIKDLTGNDYILQKVYANGQTYGLNGSFHKDDLNENSYTFLYYANQEWYPEWAGGTAFETPEGCITLPYIPNSATIFNSNISHAGMEPTRDFTGLRTTVAFKLLLK